MNQVSGGKPEQGKDAPGEMYLKKMIAVLICPVIIMIYFYHQL